MSKTLPINVDVINGEVSEFSKEMYFRTDLIIPIGNDIVRYFNDAMCSVAHKTFYFQYGQELFGTSQFKSFDDYWQYMSVGTRSSGL